MVYTHVALYFIQEGAPFMSKDQKDYSGPVVDKLAGAEALAVEVVETAVEPAKKEVTRLPGIVIPDQIGIGRLLNAKATAVTDILTARVAQHLEYTLGEKGFADRKAQGEEQGGFINTVLSSLELDFDKYVVVTDFLLTQLRENADSISTGKLLRHMGGLAESYEKEKIRKYTTYMSFLTRIALNWNIRYKLNSLIDVNLFVAGFSEKGRKNISVYFNNLQNV